MENEYIIREGEKPMFKPDEKQILVEDVKIATKGVNDGKRNQESN